MKENLISVIMGAYNSDPARLRLAVESILDQSYEYFEFIICDDCTTSKNTIDELKAIEKLDKRIILLHNSKNEGLAHSLNNCLQIANGEFVARMDDDDISHFNRFEKQISYLKTHPSIDFVGCGINLINNEGVWGSLFNKKMPTKEDFLFATPFTHPTIMVRKKVYDEVNGYSVEKRTKRTEDYDLFMRMYAKGFQGDNIQEILFDYCLDENGYRKQKFRYRIDEVVIKHRGFKRLGLLPKGYLYLLKPLISGILPQKVKKLIFKRRFISKRT